jgi:uncharacterized protein YcbX
MQLRVAALHRYPVKGLSPEPLDFADLSTGGYFPGDRLFAIENGPSGFDPAQPAHQSKIKFLMLMRNEALARLRTRYHDASTTLTIELEGREAARGDLSTREGRLAIEAFMRRFVPRDLRGPPKVVAAPNGFRFTDSRSGYASIINLASVQAIENLVGAPIDPVRFRGNIHVEGLAPWAEFDLVGRRLGGPDGLVVEVTKRIDRCAAINVDPQSGLRDRDMLPTMMRHLGHADCGVYVAIRRGGRLQRGDSLVPLQAELDLTLTEPGAGR